MHIPPVPLSSLEAALKRQPRATKAEIKLLISEQLKTHLAVHDGDRAMVEKMIDCKKPCSTLNSQ